MISEKNYSSDIFSQPPGSNAPNTGMHSVVGGLEGTNGDVRWNKITGAISGGTEEVGRRNGNRVSRAYLKMSYFSNLKFNIKYWQ